MEAGTYILIIPASSREQSLNSNSKAVLKTIQLGTGTPCSAALCKRYTVLFSGWQQSISTPRSLGSQKQEGWSVWVGQDSCTAHTEWEKALCRQAEQNTSALHSNTHIRKWGDPSRYRTIFPVCPVPDGEASSQKGTLLNAVHEMKCYTDQMDFLRSQFLIL